MIWESVTTDDKATARLHAKFWREIHHIKCVKSHVNMIIIHKFRGEQSEIEFLKFVGRSVEKLRALVAVVTKEIFTSACKLNEVITKAVALSRGAWACHVCVMVVGPSVEYCWSFRRASDPSVNDPFDC
jgi:hexokinase